MRYLLIAFLLSGCVTLASVEREKFEYTKQEKRIERLEKKRAQGRDKILRLRAVRLKIKEVLRNRTERDIILDSFKDSGIILKAFEKIGLSMFDIAGFLNEYGKNDMQGFCDYLEGWTDRQGMYHDGRFPFNTKAKWWLDQNIFIPAKRNNDLIIRLKTGARHGDK